MKQGIQHSTGTIEEILFKTVSTDDSTLSCVKQTVTGNYCIRKVELFITEGETKISGIAVTDSIEWVRNFGTTSGSAVSLGAADFGMHGCLSKIEPFVDQSRDISGFVFYSHEYPVIYWATWKVLIDDGIYTGGLGWAMWILMLLFVVGTVYLYF